MATTKRTNTKLETVSLLLYNQRRLFGLLTVPSVIGAFATEEQARAVADRYNGEEWAVEDGAYEVRTVPLIHPAAPAKTKDFAKKTATGSGAVKFATTKNGNLADKKPRKRAA